MRSYKLSFAKKKFSQIRLNRKDSTYSLTPFILKWIRENPPLLSFNSKSSEMTFDTWKQQIHNLILKKLNILQALPSNKQKVEILGETLVNGIRFIKLS
ncbi:MAG: hypothetical protein ACFFEY_09470 [Candidatus Thorarchaeota archaeon]